MIKSHKLATTSTAMVLATVLLAADGCDADEAPEIRDAASGALLFDLTLDEVQQLHARYGLTEDLGTTVDKLTAPFDCSLHGSLCERFGPEGAMEIVAEQVELGLAGASEAELADTLAASLVDAPVPSSAGTTIDDVASNFVTPVSPLLLPTQSCNVTYLPPAGFSSIDPVALLAGAASDCSVGTADSPCAPHHVYSPDPSRMREPLFVFLPGTNMEPDKHDLVLMTAASTGYRSIGLSYDNTVSAADACVGQMDCGLNCPGDMREEVIRGVDVSPNVDVARGDSILVRLYRVLEELDTSDPNGGWGAYYVPTAGSISSSNIVWDKIIFGGFSQGAGHAAMISHVRQVHGLFVIDGAMDTCQDPVLGTLAADWITTGTDASAGRPKYGFRHDHGTGDTVPDVAWQALGIGTWLFNIDCVLPGCDVIDMIPPPQASVTAQGHPSAPCNDHASMAFDGCMPTDVTGATAATVPQDGRLFEPYARRLCYACDATTCP